jgi:hypothetical protein
MRKRKSKTVCSEKSKYIKNENEKAWAKKQRKMKLIVNIIDALSNETVGGFCKDCANYQKDKCYCEALRVYLVPDYGYCWMFEDGYC